MHRRRTLFAAALTVSCLAGCHLERPDQDNFLITARPVGGAAVAQHLSEQLGATVHVTPLTLPGWQGAQMYQLEGRGFTLVMMPLPDDRCGSSTNQTFTNQIFRLDLVYTGTSGTGATAKANMLKSLAGLRVPVEKFAECK